MGQRFLDNGLLDFLLNEREAGRIRHLGFSYHGDVGASYADRQFMLTAGNTRDYPLMHGRVLAEMGYSYCSASAAAITDTAALRGYNVVDMICGKQRTELRQTSMADTPNTLYEMFPAGLRAALVDYARQGGKLLMSGMYLGSEAEALGNCDLTREVLRYTYRGDHATKCGTVMFDHTLAMQLARLKMQPDADIICCENPHAGNGMTGDSPSGASMGTPSSSTTV